MTLIAAFASPSFSVMVADRRRTQLKSMVQLDDVRKLHRVNDNLMVGFSGIYHHIGNGQFRGLAEVVINSCAYLINDKTTVEMLAQIYSDFILRQINAGASKDDLEITFHLAGLDATGNFALARVSCFEEFEPVITTPNEGGITWGISRADYSPSFWLEAQIASLKEITPTSIERLAVELVEHTAKHDGYVSRTYDMLTLSR